MEQVVITRSRQK